MKLKNILITLLLVVVVLALSLFITSRVSSTLIVTRSFSTNLENAWFVWNNEGSIKNWWGVKGANNLSIENNFQVNGQFLFSTQSPGGVVLSVAGKYSEITPNQKIVSTFFIADASGEALAAAENPLPGKWRPGILKVEFKEVGTKVQIKITQTQVPLLMKPIANWAWTQQLDKYSESLK